MVLADGAIFEGRLDDNGLLTGVGTLSWKSGARYEGEFADGAMHGQGTYTTDTGLRYEGGWRDGLWHGNGRVDYSDGSRFEGTFVRGDIDGSGKWTVEGEYEYTGEVKRGGRFHGHGFIVYDGGGSYEGAFVDGEFEGKGRYTTAAGYVYDGDFTAGNFTGEGVANTSNSETYSGTFEDWSLHGTGLYATAAGVRYQGEFQYGQFEGEGVFIDEENGVHYQGGFKSGRFNGTGTLTDKDGNVYTGEFRRGRKHGKGKLVYATPLDGVFEIEGEWRYGTLVDGGESVKIYKPEAVSEHFLYQQQNLLEREISKLRSGSAETEVFFLGIAGWGKEEVFRRELMTMNKLIAQQFDTAGRNLLLVNSRRHIDQPIATVTSIRDGINALARRMDTKDDILMLFMTSHGTKESGLGLSHAGITLADLTPEALDEMLDEAGIVHRIVIVSACYSGTFVEPLADEYSKVLTSASADATSFGCSDDSELTHFGKAMATTMPMSQDLKTAFNGAVELIEGWEEEQGLPASAPQLHSGAAIDAKLQNWSSKR